MAELLPCPFCGGKAFINTYDYEGFGKTYYVFCTNCQVETFERNTEVEAVEAWNRRAGDGK